MNELQRQQYLSAIGLDSYMPRMHLPFAPISIACELPVAAIEVDSFSITEPVVPAPQIRQAMVSEAGSSPANHLIGDFLEPKRPAKPASPITSAADILASLNTKPVTLEPFSLSIWRPVDNLLVIDSRNTKLALPTELLLKNILRSVFGVQPLQMQEEILRWPMIENSFAKRTLAEARNELQTWLTVQCEIRPVSHIWLMGESAGNYLLNEQDNFTDSLFRSCALAEVKLAGLLLPSLNELLQQPRRKHQLFTALSSYHSSHQ